MVLAAVAAVISGMQIYAQRGLQARYKQGVDYAISRIQSEAVDKGIDSLSSISTQYEPYYRQASTSVATNSENTIGFPTTITNETSNRSGWESVASGYDAD